MILIRLLHWILSICLISCPLSMVAAPDFNIAHAQQELQIIASKLSYENVSTQRLRNLQLTVTELHDAAVTCVNNEKNKLSDIANLEKELDDLGKESPSYERDQQYVKSKKHVVTERLFNCRLMTMQAMDLQTQIQAKAESIASDQSSVAGKPVYEAVSGVFLTIGAILIFIAIVYLGNIIFDSARLHNVSVIPQRYIEFRLFKFSLYALLAIWVVLMLLEWWGVPINILTNVKDTLIAGGTVYGVKIIPMRLLLGIIVFAIIQMTWKYTLFYVSKKKKIDPNADSQVVLTSLISYVVFIVAILIGLSISGVNFTGLAIVAGALTVGIGFGLQNIVNNFVSGIILLIEQTVKPGDRVSIKGYEGIVRKINLRFTRIATGNKEDVLIPNSDLISTPIINYEFEDKLYAVHCFVGVAYSSDLAMVKQVLLNLTLKHPEILQDPLNKPKVFVNEFADSNIMLELECVIVDVNRKHLVTSDLYFLIHSTFTENNIEIAYPQLNVTLKQES